MGRNKTQGRGPSQEAGRRKGAPLRQGGTSRLDGVKDAAVQKCRAWHSDSHESPPPIHHETICRYDGQMPHIRRTCLAFHSWKLDFSHGRQDEFVKYVAGGIFRYGHAQRSSDVILWFAASGAFCIGSNAPDVDQVRGTARGLSAVADSVVMSGWGMPRNALCAPSALRGFGTKKTHAN